MRLIFLRQNCRVRFQFVRLALLFNDQSLVAVDKQAVLLDTHEKHSVFVVVELRRFNNAECFTLSRRWIPDHGSSRQWSRPKLVSSVLEIGICPFPASATCECDSSAQLIPRGCEFRFDLEAW
jgi:hypothetical protein